MINNRKIKDLLIRCKDKETGEEGYVSLEKIGEAIFTSLIEEKQININPIKNDKM